MDNYLNRIAQIPNTICMGVDIAKPGTKDKSVVVIFVDGQIAEAYELKPGLTRDEHEEQLKQLADHYKPHYIKNLK